MKKLNRIIVWKSMSKKQRNAARLLAIRQAPVYYTCEFGDGFPESFAQAAEQARSIGWAPQPLNEVR